MSNSIVKAVNEADAHVRLFLAGSLTFLELTERLTALGASAVDERGFVLHGLRLKFKDAQNVFLFS